MTVKMKRGLRRRFADWRARRRGEIHFTFVRCTSPKCAYVFAIHEGGEFHGQWEGPFIPVDSHSRVNIQFTFGTYDDSCVQMRKAEDVPEMWGDCRFEEVLYTPVDRTG